MKKTALLIWLLLFLCVTAHADEALMWISQSDPQLHTAENFQRQTLTYDHPMQYRLEMLPLSLIEIPDSLFSIRYGPVSVFQDNHTWYAASTVFDSTAAMTSSVLFPGVDDLPADTPAIKQLQQLLQGIGWTDADQPDMYCTAAQIVQRGTNPIERGHFYVSALPEGQWDAFSFVHFSQKIDGLSLAVWVEDADEDAYETRDASFVLDPDGRVIAGRVFPGYTVVATSELPGTMLTAYDAGERFLKLMLDRYTWTKTWDGLETYDCSWSITQFEKGLVLTLQDIALPAWRIHYRMTMTDSTTGETSVIERIYTINALTGAG